MALALSDNQARLLRLRAQQLAPPRARPVAGVARVVSSLVGVQAQDSAAAALAIRARRAGLVVADVERALAEERSIVRTWGMRGTLHLVAAEDAGWLLGLLGPVFSRATRGRRAQLGLGEEAGARAVGALWRLLADSGPLTRAEIVEGLASRGIRLAGQARPHLLSLAAFEGRVCHGPSRGREPTYVLLADWIDPGPALPRERALAELARWYLSAYAPATPEDLAAWSGLSLTDARAAWQQISSRMAQVEIGGSTAWMLKSQMKWLGKDAGPRPIVRLLPAFDAYLLGYRNRELIVPARHAKRIFPGGGLLRPALLLNGRVTGTWKAQRRRNATEVVVEAFESLPRDVRQALEAEVEHIGHFLSAEASLTMIKPR